MTRPKGVRAVATIFYNANAQRQSAVEPASPRSPLEAIPPIPQPTSSLSALGTGAVPTEDLATYPLEPPVVEAEREPPSDRLYGTFVSRSCCSDFVSTLANLLPHFSEEDCVWRDLCGGDAAWDEKDHGISPSQSIGSLHPTASGTSTSLSSSLTLTHGPLVKELTFTLPPSPVSTSGNTSTRDILRSLSDEEALSVFERTWAVEVILQPSSVFRTHKRLAVFDMDSTLIGQEVIDEVAATLNLQPEVAAITAAAMNGELDFETSLRKRCQLLKGTPSDVWTSLQNSGRITLTPGAEELVRALRRLGFRTAVLSGGFEPMAAWLARKIGLDYVFANNLAVSEDGAHLTGELVGPIVHAQRKRDLVLELAEKEGVVLEQVMAVGDGANDLPMLRTAGLGVAFNAKARVQLEAPARINRESLRDLLYLLGLTKGEQEELLKG